MEFTDEKALELIREEKQFKEISVINFPQQNEFKTLKVYSTENDNEYYIDINRKRAILTRCTYQNRAKKTIPLVRLDIDTKPHRNPDGKTISGNHIHIYRDGYDLKWAYELDSTILKNYFPENLSLIKNITVPSLDLMDIFEKFCLINNISNMPLIQPQLK